VVTSRLTTIGVCGILVNLGSTRSLNLIVQPRCHISNEPVSRRMFSTQANVIIVGAGHVGLFTALRLGQAGARVVVVEKDHAVLQLPRSLGYYPVVQVAFQEAGIYNTILQNGGSLTTGMEWRRYPTDGDEGSGSKKAGELVGAMPKKQILSA
jgi:2-polyprenyl-6-methoxyphenol hydroxylase-like FAD-dependent oxidoreductase